MCWGNNGALWIILLLLLLCGCGNGCGCGTPYCGGGSRPCSENSGRAEACGSDCSEDCGCCEACS